MAATKKSTPAKTTKANTDSAPVTRADNILQALVPRRPALDSHERALFIAKYTDAKCESMGAGTRSEGVLREALAWAPIIDKSLTAHPIELRRYGAKRFSWYLECAAKLAAARALQQTRGAAPLARKAALEQAQKAALAARAELADSLEELVEGDDTEESALSAALGTTDRLDRIIASLATLTTYAHDWLARPDQASRTKLQFFGLTRAEVETAETAAATLAAAAAGKTLEGAVITRDSPEVNRIEGRVLLEMRAAMRVFNKANAANKQIPKLVPGTATRHALLSRSTKPGKVAPAGGAEGAPGKGGAAPGAQNE